MKEVKVVSESQASFDSLQILMTEFCFGFRLIVADYGNQTPH